MLLIGRALQGFSAAAVWVVGLAMLVDTVGEDRMTESMGYVSLATVGGLLTSPVLGGVVYQKGGYYSVFVVAFTFIVLDILLRLLVIERSSAAQWPGNNLQSGYGTFEAPGSDPETMPSEHLCPCCVNSISSRPEISNDPDSFSNAGLPLITSGDRPAESNFVTIHYPLLTLLLSPRLLVALWGCFAQIILLTSLEGV